ncbi:MAG: hypothetical protein P8P74_09505 [Crocinitomicaceae bacterium]|nr:hypothetical protein [Crocinitomicaceae bacterium]
MSFLFLLLVGMNSNARASVAVNDAIENSTDDDQSNEEAPEHEPGEMITNLDFFGAFSLVNVQLQWRDLFVDLTEDESDSDSAIDPNELFVDGIDFFSLTTSDEFQSAAAIVNIGITLIPETTYRSVDGKVNADPILSEQSMRTIAYILNCGTYPKSC